jgi:hypothetical protein
MRTARLGFVSLMICLALACRLPAQTSTATQANPPSWTQAAADDIVVRLAKARSINDVDRLLKQLVAGKKTVGNLEWLLELVETHGSRSAQIVASLVRILEESATNPPGQMNVELLLAGWGKHGSWYDLAVMRYVWRFWPRVFHPGEMQIDALRLIQILRQRVEEQPKLLEQLFWYAQWEHRGMKFKEICEASRTPYENSCAGAEFPAILFIAGALGQGWLIESGNPPVSGKATAEQVCDYWIMTGQLYFLAIRPFVRYDSHRHIYVYDAATDHENRYLKPEEQEPVCPSTPLPDWASKIMPEPPAREK